ncbi:LysR substrate-binding domain-containing protein [Brotaphodocola catenula]|uniref:LysR family transcriptional regulator n=1 Tax=Brotaphodocola catenula TaxID=2885361 RepID=A0AAE3ATM7_9FIRM|nr:LysR substrate-binding domain-containing protein [Brotaphodocola catenula]MCC2165245.1 LysR family transcriptional regulator [Brotaphodocola catenula]
MNERQLRYLETIAEQGSIQKASSLLKRDASTLNRVVRSVGEELGVTLFRRSHSGVVPTPEGEVVLAFGRRIREIFMKIRTLGNIETSYLREWTESDVCYLIEIRQQKNISRAADELFIAQPSLSQAVIQIEESLGISLFLRTSEGVEETVAGGSILDQLEQVQALSRQMRVELEAYQQMKKGILTVGIPVNLAAYVLPAVLPEFSELYPGIQVKFRENNSMELERLLFQKKVDFCVMHFQEESPGLQYEKFLEDPFYLVLPMSWHGRFPFQKNQPLTAVQISLLAQEPFILVESRQKLRLVGDQILNCAGIIPDVRYVSKSMETTKRLVAAGLGATFLPRSYLTLFSGTEGLEYFPIDRSVHALWQLVAAYRKEEELPLSARKFLEISKREMEKGL